MMRTPLMQARKRDVILKLGRQTGAAASVRVVQLDNAFPFGSCINTSVIQKPAFLDFFTNHFDWAVFENELKWYHTEAQQGQLNYADADALLSARPHIVGHLVHLDRLRFASPVPRAVGLRPHLASARFRATLASARRRRSPPLLSSSSLSPFSRSAGLRLRCSPLPAVGLGADGVDGVQWIQGLATGSSARTRVASSGVVADTLSSSYIGVFLILCMVKGRRRERGATAAPAMHGPVGV